MRQLFLRYSVLTKTSLLIETCVLKQIAVACEFEPPQNCFNQKHFSFFFIENFSDYLLYNMVIFGIKMTAMKCSMISFILKMNYSWIFSDFFFIIFEYIFYHSDLDLRPKVINFNRVRGNVISNYLAKTASKSVYRFDRHFVNKRTDRQTDTHTHTQTDKLKWKYNPSTISLRCKNPCSRSFYDIRLL